MPRIDPAPTDTRTAHPEHIVATGDALRNALRAVPSPIVVVTLWTDAGPRGATIGSFASVSLDPPLVSFNVTHDTRLHDALAETDALAIHFLAADQADIATRFAIPDLSGHDQLEPFDHQLVDGTPPLIDGVLSTLVCTTATTIEAGDHSVIIASVEAIRPGRETAPLLYYEQSYRGIGAPVDG
ncbi:MAG: flavin reductase family protein [Rubricoccaceae bacterium]